MWLMWAAISVMGWGVWGVAMARASAFGGAVGVTAGMLAAEALILIWAWPQIPAAFSWWMVVAGVASAGAYVALTRSIQVGGEPGVVFALTALYPALIAIGAWLVLGERLSGTQWLGVVMAVFAAALLAN